MNRKSKKVFEGIVLVFLALALILSAANVSIFGRLLGGVSPFRLIASVLLLYIGVKGLVERNWFMVFFPFAVILILLGGYYGIPNIPTWILIVSAVLLSIGLEKILPGKHIHITHHGDDWDSDTDDYRSNGEFVEVSNGMDVDVSFGSSCKYFESDDFTTSNLEANFGSIKAYYDKAKMRDMTAHINAEANFGEIDIYVPREWETKIKTDKAFGGVDEKGSVVWDGVHIVYIDAEANFGSIIIHHM